MNWKKVNVHIVHSNGGLGTLRCLNNLKKFNYTKIDKKNCFEGRT